MLIKLDLEKDIILTDFITKGLAFKFQVEDKNEDIYEFVKSSRMIYNNIIPKRKYYLKIKNALDFIIALAAVIVLIPAFI